MAFVILSHKTFTNQHFACSGSLALKYSLEFIRNLIFADITSSKVVHRYGVGILHEFQNPRLNKSETPLFSKSISQTRSVFPYAAVSLSSVP